MAVILPGNKGGVARAAELLRAGQPVGVPTETVYGLAARADSSDAVAAVYRAKGRPSFNPLIVHVAGLEMAERIGRFDDRARDLARQYWPGPLTLVLPLREEAGIAPAVTAGLPTIALRHPDHPLIAQLIRQLGLPLAAPSANRSEGISPTCAEHVVRSLEDRIEAVLDGGACRAGLESTIVALREEGGWNLLREGPVTRDELAATLGPESDSEGDRIEAPGQLARHYAPGKPVRLNAAIAKEDEFLIGFGDMAGEVNLSPSGDLFEAAARLYACLHEAAASEKPRIAVAPIPEKGVGAAINDRLRRAAA